MAKSQRHKKIARKKTKKARRQAKAKEASAPKRWTRDISWRHRKEPKATFEDVIKVFELAEHVLGYLPVQDLINAQQVCFKSNSTIEQSSTLRKKLFLEADDTEKSIWQLVHNRVESYDQPIEILQAAPRKYTDQEVVYEVCSKSMHQTWKTIRLPKVLNSLILNLLPLLGRTNIKPSLVNRMQRATVGNDIQPERLMLQFDIRTLPPESKIQKMFLTQPPTKSLSIRCSYSWCDVPRTTHLFREHGIRVSDLAEAWKEYEKLHDAGTDEVWYPHSEFFCDSYFSIEVEILDGLAVTEAEEQVVYFGDQKDTSLEHGDPRAYRRVYPYSYTVSNFEVFPTPLRRKALGPVDNVFDSLSS